MTLDVKMKWFGGFCPKCSAPTGLRTHCPGCDERPKTEHLHSSCTSCGYGWIENTADAKSAKPKKGGSR